MSHYETKVKMSGDHAWCHIWQKLGKTTAYHQAPHTIILSSMVVEWRGKDLDLFCSHRKKNVHKCVVIETIRNYTLYQNILDTNVRPSVWQQTLGQIWVIEWDNEPKYTSKWTSEWIKKKNKGAKVSPEASLVWLQYPCDS